MKQKVEKFVMITPRAVSPAGTKPRIHLPLGALSVLSEIKRNGYEVLLYDIAAEGLKKNFLNPLYNPVITEKIDGFLYWKTGLKDDDILNDLSIINPDVIGINCSTIVDRGEVSKIAKLLKNNFPDKPIILGGHEASHWFKEILGETQFFIESIPEIDYIVVGPGQPVISKLLNFISKNKSKNDLPPGVACRFSGSVKFNQSHVNFSPDNYAIPDYNLVKNVMLDGREKPLDIYSYFGNPHAGFINSFLKTDKPISYLPILTSYGCGFNCSFCDTDKKLTRYSVENTITIIKEFEKLFGIDYIDFMDNNFGGGNNVSRSLAFEILKEVSKMNYKIGFSNGLTFESMHRNDFQLLKDFSEHGNVMHIAFPCENGNDRVLNMIRKPHSLSLVRKTLEFAKTNLRFTNREGFFIGGFPETYGHPAETPEEIENTFVLIKECLENEFLHQAIFLTLSPVTREYRMLWRQMYPNASFEHCLFSRMTGIWPYPNEIIDQMHNRVNVLNNNLGRFITRKL